MFLEWWHKILPTLGSPRITRYVAAVLAKDHYFKTDRAQADFGFQSIVSIEEKTQEFLQWIAANETS